MRHTNEINENDKKNYQKRKKKMLIALAWGIRGSTDPNENDEEGEKNHFDENYKKKKLLSAIAWSMRGSKAGNENGDQNNKSKDFDENCKVIDE